MASSAEQIKAARRVAHAVRFHGADSEQVRAARAALTDAQYAARLEAAVREVVERAPELTDAQVERLTLLLRPGTGYDQGA